MVRDPILRALGISEASGRAMRLFDFIVLPIVFVALMVAFHLHFMLTAGDWDFWVDWKDRLYWPMITCISSIMFMAAAQSILWNMFRLPMGATVVALGLVIAEWITRYFQFHLWSYFPLSEVWPATLIPSALFLDAVLLLTRNWVVTAIIGSMGYAFLFPFANWIMLAPFNLPTQVMGQDLTVADLIGFGYVRGGTPEYLRMIEEGGLRVLAVGETWFIASLFAGFVCIFLYMLWWWVAVLLGKASTARNPLRPWLSAKRDASDDEPGILVEDYPVRRVAP